jgi:hypothetical protein
MLCGGRRGNCGGRFNTRFNAGCDLRLDPRLSQCRSGFCQIRWRRKNGIRRSDRARLPIFLLAVSGLTVAWATIAIAIPVTPTVTMAIPITASTAVALAFRTFRPRGTLFRRCGLTGLKAQDFVFRRADNGIVLLAVLKEIGNVKKRITLQSNVHESGLHSGKDARNTAFVNAAREGIFFFTLVVNFHELVIFQNRHAGFMLTRGND